LRKVASAFVVIDEAASATAEPASAEQEGLADMAKETSTLLAQLERRPAAEGIAGAQPQTDLLDWTAEDVFRDSAIQDSPNSALRLIKLIAGLSMFPREQQLAMVRAMDQADDSWAEPDVVQDARKRQGLLRAHLTKVAQYRAERSAEIATAIETTNQNGRAVLAELDQRIAALYARREQEAAETAAAISKFEQQQKELDAREARARQGTAQVIQALGGLLSFVGASQGPENG
jgi:hypothetical protein